MTRSRVAIGLVAATAAAVALVGLASASAPPLSGSLVRNADGSYTLTVQTSASGMNDINLIVPAGTTVKITKGPHCKLASSTTIDCPGAVAAAKQDVAVTFTATPALSPAAPLFLTVQGTSNSYEIKVFAGKAATSGGGGSSSGGKYDLSVEIKGDHWGFDATEAPQRFTYFVVVTNLGPGTSPALPSVSGEGVGIGAQFHVTKVLLAPIGAGCASERYSEVCPVHALAAHGRQTWKVVVLWSRADVARQGDRGDLDVGASVNRIACEKAETSCKNNHFLNTSQAK